VELGRRVLIGSQYWRAEEEEKKMKEIRKAVKDEGRWRDLNALKAETLRLRRAHVF
jgi:hypothetical protein